MTLDDFIDWLLYMRSAGFSGDAEVKIGKTTGQINVLIISEEKWEQGSMVPERRDAPDPRESRQRIEEYQPPPMWPEQE